MTTDKIDARIIERIRKALVLGQAKNDHESQTAMLLAQQLMAKHGIDAEDIEFDGGPKPKEIIEMYGSKATKTQWWHRDLSMVIADNFRCYTFTRGSRGKSRIVFLGVKEDTQIAREVYLYAVDSIEYLSIAYLNNEGIEGLSQRNSIRNDYIQGFIVGLKAKFHEQVVSNQYEIILKKDADLVERHEGMKFSTTPPSTAQSAGDMHAYGAGIKDGKRMDHTNKSLK